MKQTIGVKVQFTRKNAQKCLCGGCPVQSESQCVKDNSKKIGDIMSSPKFEPELLPRLYCSSGVASCKDIDLNQSCICGDCDVYDNYILGDGQPLDYFCKNGNAG